MAQKYYFDTSIWIDYFENRKDKFRPLGDWAFELIKKIKQQNELILYSDVVADELSKFYDNEKLKQAFNLADCETVMVYINSSESQFKEATKIAKQRNLPLGDVLHAIIARDNEAIMVSRDKHFEELLDITQAFKPEQLI